MSAATMSILDAVERVYGIDARERIVAEMLPAPRTEPPIPAAILCPYCGARHVDGGKWATIPHHKHLCGECGKLFRVEGVRGEFFVGVDETTCFVCGERGSPPRCSHNVEPQLHVPRMSTTHASKKSNDGAGCASCGEPASSPFGCSHCFEASE